MKSITELVNERRRTKEEKPIGKQGQVPSDEFVAVNGKVMSMAKVKKDEGKKPEANSSRGTFAINPPSPSEKVDISDAFDSKNKKNLLAKFRTKEDFFIEGRAGWGKTSLVEGLCSNFNLTYIPVFLDKAMASDLGGIPIPTRSERGAAKQEYAMPAWAAYMYEHPEEQCLLFFDEMNQAAPDVMNALMPIVLNHEICGIKFDNFFVGAAGNLKSENGAVNELSGPLKSRFKPIIHWESHTEKSWTEAFKYLHTKWDGSFGKDFIDKFEENAMVFDNPRELDHKLFKFIYNLVTSDGDNDMFDAEYFKERLIQLTEKEDEDELERSEVDAISKLAENIYEFIQTGGKPKEEKTKQRKGRDMIPTRIQDELKNCIKSGYVLVSHNGEPEEKWGVSRENINLLFDEDCGINAEMLERFIKKCEADGIKFKYETNKDIEKDGLKPIYDYYED